MRGDLCFDIRKAGTLHGFTAWFSVHFQSLEDGQPPQVLSTGPFHPPVPGPRQASNCHASLSCRTTHWKQTLFMMDDPVPVHTGDVVTGSVVLQRNPVWRRHMSVSLSWAVTSREDPSSQRVQSQESISVPAAQEPSAVGASSANTCYMAIVPSCPQAHLQSDQQPRVTQQKAKREKLALNLWLGGRGRLQGHLSAQPWKKQHAQGEGAEQWK
ncbi:Protein arginine N-methyltransferase 2 [Tupaia chinensis]|uniref:Protein arginine N-methyltransferase 2 n=1 Tax=Tupaia chinensis TaxID=246437 RepID=L8YA08_TUPCH|nr:Protein arginine N-methyltransferase 2 [Tupaia chinensis]